MKPAQSSDRWRELDGVRGLAALLVVYAHLFLMWIPASSGIAFWLRSFSGLAWTGVYLFFVLSGFLIGGILLQHRTAPNYFAVFYTRRALRIFPLYFLLLGVFVVLRSTPWFASAPSFAPTGIPLWTYGLLVQNFPMAVTGNWGAAPLGVTWSVALEEQFYLFLPLCIWLVPKRAQLPVFAVLAATGPVFRALAPLHYSPFLMPGSIEALFSGAMLAWVFHERPVLIRSTRTRVAALAGLVAGGVGMGLMLLRVRLGVFNITAITLFWTSFLWLVLGAMNTPWTALLRSRALCWVGTVSYGVYLFHGLIYGCLFVLLTGAGPRHEVGGRMGLLIATASLLLVLAMAGLSYFGMERRLMERGRRFRYGAPRAPEPTLLPVGVTPVAMPGRVWSALQAVTRTRRIAFTAGARLPRLDVLRGLAIVLVVAFHYSQLLTPLRGEAAVRAWVAGLAAGLPGWMEHGARYLAMPVTHGRFGVTLFFIISGYCIHIAYLRWRERNPQSPPHAFTGIFVWRRFWRIYPPMLVALLLGWVGGYTSSLWAPPVLRHLGASLLMARNFSPGSMLVMNGALWSVNIEWQLYLLFPLLLILAGGRRWLLPVAAMAGLVSWFWVFGIPGRTQADWIRQLPVLWWAEWILGVVLAELHVRGRTLFPHAGAWCLALGAAAAWWVSWAPSSQLGWLLPRLAFAALVEWAVLARAPLGWSERGLAAIGLRSYSIYLFHLPLMLALGAVLRRSPWQWDDPRVWLVLLPVYAALTYTVGALSQKWLELPSVSAGEWLRGRWTGRRAPRSDVRKAISDATPVRLPPSVPPANLAVPLPPSG